TRCATCTRNEVRQQIAFAFDLLVNRANGNRACDLARSVAAHSIRHHEERELLVDEEVVLVVLTNAPNVGRSKKPNGIRRRRHNMTRESWHDAVHAVERAVRITL